MKDARAAHLLRSHSHCSKQTLLPAAYRLFGSRSTVCKPICPRKGLRMRPTVICKTPKRTDSFILREFTYSSSLLAPWLSSQGRRCTIANSKGLLCEHGTMPGPVKAKWIWARATLVFHLKKPRRCAVGRCAMHRKSSLHADRATSKVGIQLPSPASWHWSILSLFRIITLQEAKCSILQDAKPKASA